MSESGKVQEGKGRLKEAAGALTGDGEKAGEGRDDEAKGKMRQAGEKVSDAIDDVKDALRK